MSLPLTETVVFGGLDDEAAESCHPSGEDVEHLIVSSSGGCAGEARAGSRMPRVDLKVSACQVAVRAVERGDVGRRKTEEPANSKPHGAVVKASVWRCGSCCDPEGCLGSSYGFQSS